jgi:hypothetical protein
VPDEGLGTADSRALLQLGEGAVVSLTAAAEPTS